MAKAKDDHLILTLDLSLDYEFQVLGVCLYNESVWSDSYFWENGTGIAPLPGSDDRECQPPAVDGLTATLHENEATITWHGGEQFASYALYYRAIGEEYWNKVTTPSTAITVEALDPDVVYEYKLQYTCADGTTTTGPIKTFTVIIAEDITTVTNPGTGWCYYPSGIRHELLNDSTVTLAWEAEPQVKKYEISYRPTDGSEHWRDSLFTNREQFTLNGLKANSRYEYKIRSICGDGTPSIYSDKNYFDTETPFTYDGPCEAVEDAIALPISGFLARFHWTGQPYHTGYMISIRPEGSSNWFEYPSSDTVKTLQGLIPSTSYEYKITGLCGTEYGAYTLVSTFTTLPAEQVATGEFVCGASDDIKVEEQIPVPSLAIGDMVKAADFEVEITALNSGWPYNGEAIVTCPYFNYARLTLQMVNCQVNKDYELYGGQLHMLSADVILYEMPATGRLAQALLLLSKINGDYLEHLDEIESIINEIMGALGDFPDVKGLISGTVEKVRDEVQKAKQARDRGDKEGGESFAKQAVDLLKGAAEDALNALMDLPKALGEALTNIPKWVKETLEKLKADKEKEKEELSEERDSLWQRIRDWFDKEEDETFVSIEDVRRVKTEIELQPFTEEEFERYKNDPKFKGYFDLLGRLKEVEFNLENASKFFNYVQVFLYPNNIPKLVTKVEDDLGSTLEDLGKDLLGGKDIEGAAKEAIETLLIDNINELVAETPTTDISNEVDEYLWILDMEGLDNIENVDFE